MLLNDLAKAEGKPMKMQKRNFVVEIKSSRRRPRTEARSIWGDTDFKALSREAEAADFPLNSPVSATIKPSGELRTDPEPFAEGLDAGSDRPSAMATHAGPADLPASVAASVRSDSPEPVVSFEHSPQLPPVADAKSRRKGRDKTPRRATTLPVPGLMDEIASLEAEKHRLTLLLRQHLREQNLQLRRMLERFERAT